ncbi:arginine deiminase-related protein [Vibrio chagasii]|nr:arginine deiminase-related protein [Vibrio chagasii]
MANILQLETVNGDRIAVMSQSAYDVLSSSACSAIDSWKVATIRCKTIEDIGGGSRSTLHAW